MLVIYPRLQLDAIKNNGVIRFCHLEETFEKEQAVGLGEKTETVKRTMEFLLSSGLCVERQITLLRKVEAIIKIKYRQIRECEVKHVIMSYLPFCVNMAKRK